MLLPYYVHIIRNYEKLVKTVLKANLFLLKRF